MKKIILLLAVVLAVVTARSQTYTSIANGNWSAGTTWDANGVPPFTIPVGATVKILHRVSYNLNNDMVINGSLIVGTNPGGMGDTLRFPNDGSVGTGKSIIIGNTGYLGVFNAGVIMPLFLTNGTTPNSGNVKNEGGRCEYYKSLAEAAQNWESAGAASRRKFTNSCIKAGENYINEGKDTLIGVCIEVGAHGSGSFINTGSGTIRASLTNVLFQGSGSFNNSGSIFTYINGPGFRAINIIDGKLENAGTWNTTVSFWCASQGTSGSFTPMLPPQNCAFFTANNNFFSICKDCIPSFSPLPVEFKSFTATRINSFVQLRWETATELNNSGFNIERNINGTWQQIAWMPTMSTSGNSGVILNYTYSDPNDAKGISQYRIRQVSMDNRNKFSEIRSVRGRHQLGKTQVYPNPSPDGKVNIMFEDAAITREIILTDMSGRVVRQIGGITNNNITLKNLESGMYMIRIVATETSEQVVEKIVVNRH